MTEPGAQPAQPSAVIAAAVRGDLAELRALAAAGADLNARDEFGDPVLVAVLEVLYCEPRSDRQAIVRTLLELGADPLELGEEDAGPLAPPMFAMDTDMLRLLLDAGAQPNAEAGHLASESFYDLACFDYEHEARGFDPWPEEPTDEDRSSPEAWLQFLDRLAVRHGKRRPDHLFLLRERGARTADELRQAGERRA